MSDESIYLKYCIFINFVNVLLYHFILNRNLIKILVSSFFSDTDIYCRTVHVSKLGNSHRYFTGKQRDYSLCY